jgi:IS4 transposase
MSAPSLLSSGVTGQSSRPKLTANSFWEWLMTLDAVIARFAEQSPLTVMARLTVQRVLDPTWLDELFETERQRQYTRELLFSSVIDLMAEVALGLKPSVYAAARGRHLPVSLTAVYDKINRTDPEVVRALVRSGAERLSPVLDSLQRDRPAWVPGYEVRIVDGNHLPASEKRLEAIRGFRGAALPGQSLVVLDPDRDLVVDLLPWEDAHTQERAFVPPLLEQAQPGQLWILDRNFSTTTVLFALHQRGAAVLVREHARNPNPTAISPLRRMGSTETGEVFEQRVQLRRDEGQELDLRRIELHLKHPTEDGDTVIRLLTTLPTKKFPATRVACLYRGRWTIEGMFQRLEAALHSEVRSLGYPRAALLAFGVAVLAYNVLSVLKAAVQAEHASEPAASRLSLYYVTNEITEHYAGMMIAVPASGWVTYDRLSPRQLARQLRRLAAKVEPSRLSTHPRAPKPKKKKEYVPGHVARRHVATARVLAGTEVL